MIYFFKDDKQMGFFESFYTVNYENDAMYINIELNVENMEEIRFIYDSDELRFMESLIDYNGAVLKYHIKSITVDSKFFYKIVMECQVLDMKNFKTKKDYLLEFVKSGKRYDPTIFNTENLIKELIKNKIEF